MLVLVLSVGAAITVPQGGVAPLGYALRAFSLACPPAPPCASLWRTSPAAPPRALRTIL